MNFNAAHCILNANSKIFSQSRVCNRKVGKAQRPVVVSLGAVFDGIDLPCIGLDKTQLSDLEKAFLRAACVLESKPRF